MSHSGLVLDVFSLGSNWRVYVSLVGLRRVWTAAVSYQVR
jgi:hypothetical protein